MEVLIAILLLIVVVLVALNLYIIINGSKGSDKNQDSISVIDKAIEIQQSSINEISKDLQSFQDPINKLNRYLSGGTLAGKFCLLYTSPSPRDGLLSRMPSSA